MRRLVLLAAALVAVGCDSELGGGTARDAGSAPSDAGVRATDAGASALDAGSSTDDAGITASDAGGPDVDSGPACAPTRAACDPMSECGRPPNGCGGTVECAPCEGGEAWCGVETSRFRGAVYSCTQSVQDAHPEWFDPVMFRDTSSWLVLDASALDYVAAVAACCAATGAVCIPDPNAPGNEVRARPADGDVAENFIVRTYGTGRTAGRYTGSCSPAGF